MEKEIWKDIKGYDGLYHVSNFGRIKSLPRLRRSKNGMAIVKECILKHNIHKDGYHYIQLHNDGERKHFLVSRLVYEAFSGEIPEGMQVNHIDEDKNNNAIYNLNLMTPSENTNWATGNKRRRRKRGKKVVMDEEKIFDSTREVAKYLGCSNQAISNCCRKLIRTVFGHKFRYK